MTMRILHIVPSYIPAYRYGGPIKSVHGLCKGLAELGHDVHVFTTNVDGPNDSDVPLGVPVDIDGVKVWYFPSKRLRRLYWSPPMALALEEQVRHFDILHLHSIYLWPTWAAARSARLKKIPYIIAPRGMLVKDLVKRKSRWLKTFWLFFIEKFNLEFAAGLHVTSKLEEEDAKQFGYRLPQVFLVPNGVNLSGYKTLDIKCDTINNESGYVLFLGRLNWKKGLDRLIPAIKYLPKNIRLFIAGNDEENYQSVLEALADKHGVRSRITFTGLVQGANKEALLRNAAVLVLPSYSENFGNVVLEALAAGTPVVVTPEVGAAEIVRVGDCGIVVAGDPEHLGAALAELVANPARCCEMGERGYQLVLKKYSWAAVAMQMESAYARILGERD